jgi:hypothetical protein
LRLVLAPCFRAIAIERAALRGGILDPHRASAELLAIERADGNRRIFFGSHFDETEAAGASVEAIAHNLGAFDHSDLRECLAQIAIAKRKAQIANEYSYAHRFTVLRLLSCLIPTYSAG